MKRRDDFPKATREALALRAQYCCSYPGCPQITAGPSDESTLKFVVLGVAAHMHAASSQGPRYLGSMTPAQRAHIDNGIWLCPTHATLIDRDVQRFPAEALRQMKADHEARCSQRLPGTGGPVESTHLIQVGPELVILGDLVGASTTAWRCRVDHFVRGDLASFLQWSDRFDELHPDDRFILDNGLGDGRHLAAAPRWERQGTVVHIAAPVLPSAPRMPVQQLPQDLAIEDGDLALDGGVIKTVSGLAALPQKVWLALTTARGDLKYSQRFGTRIAEYWYLFRNSPWFGQLLKLEVIRLAAIPYWDDRIGDSYTPLGCIDRTVSVDPIVHRCSENEVVLKLTLDVRGLGPWTNEVSIRTGHRRAEFQ